MDNTTELVEMSDSETHDPLPEAQQQTTEPGEQKQPEPAKAAQDTKLPTTVSVATDVENGTKIQPRRLRRVRVGDFRKRTSKLLRDICGGCFTGIGGLSLATLIGAGVLLPFVLYAVYMYFLNYSKIYPGSKVAYDVFRNANTDQAFQFFYWTTCCITASYIALLFAFAIGGLGAYPGGCGACLLILIVLGLVSLPVWLRFPILAATHNSVFQNTCNDWDIRAILSSVSWSNYEWSLPTQVVNITLAMSNTVISLGVFRRQLTPLVYDMILSSNATQPTFFSNITYDLGAGQIFSAGPPLVNTTYDVSPNLAFPSLNLSLATDSIPWIRPNCYQCWPPAINLVHTNGTQSPQKVIQTITLNPNDCTQMLVCGSAGSELPNFQVALGFTAIYHFHYALCCTGGDSGQITFGGQDPESEFGGNGGGGEGGSKGGSKGGRG